MIILDLHLQSMIYFSCFLRLKNGERLFVSQIKGSPVKEVDLVVDGKVCDTAIEIFKKWFWQFQIDGQMKPL